VVVGLVVRLSFGVSFDSGRVVVGWHSKPVVTGDAIVREVV
jgi:hypothetical protein